MSFKDKLDKELERRDLNTTEDSASGASASGISSRKFSFQYFFLGLVLASLVGGSFIAFAALNANKTQLQLQERLSSKAALVERQTILPTMTVQPVVTMLPNEVKPPSTPENNTGAPQDTSVKQAPMPDATPIPAPNNVIDLIPDLYESTALGLKPQRREKDGLTVFEAYKSPIDLSDKPKISFVILEMGLSESKAKEIIKDMPAGVTLAFSPYAFGISGLVKEARKNNHEAWLMLPLETSNYPLDDPGPLTLLKDVSTAQNKDRLDKILTLATGYVGLIPDPKHNYTPESVRTSPVINEIFDRGLAMIESRTGANNFIKQLAIKKDAPFGQTDFWLAPEKGKEALKSELATMLTFAQGSGSALVMLYPYPSSLAAVKEFIEANQNSYQLAPASALMRYDG